jgi:hypothetical protein
VLLSKRTSRNPRARRTRSVTSARRATFEPLEDRRLMSMVWMIDGTDAADTIRLRQSGSTVSVTRNGVTTRRGDVSSVVVNGRGGNDAIAADDSVTVPLVLHGGAGNDLLAGGHADDRLYGDAGSDTLAGGAGDDVLVSIGGASDHDRLTGNSGHDNFWADSGSVDVITDRASNDAWHTVASFFTYRITRRDGSVATTAVPLTLQGQRLPDPVASKNVSGWKNFSVQPLFPAGGPSEQDVDQNGAADCYFLAPLSSVAKLAPQRIEDRVVDLGDGTYAVQFQRGGSTHFVRVDGDLPVNSSGRPYYAGLGRQSSIWTAIVEKAWAFFRSGKGTYASTDWGRIAEPYDALGLSGLAKQFNAVSFSASGGILDAIGDLLDRGYSVVYSTKNTQPSGSKLRPDHVILVDRVVRNRSGAAVGLVLRDQYKTDLATVRDGSNDGYVTLTAAQAAAWMECVAWCRV